MSNITVKVIDEAAEMLKSTLLMYRDKIDKAYLKEESSLNVALGLRFKTTEGGNVEVTDTINFVTDRVKDSFRREVVENMDELFPKKTESADGDKDVVDVEFTPALTSGMKAIEAGELKDLDEAS